MMYGVLPKPLKLLEDDLSDLELSTFKRLLREATERASAKDTD